jgi:hypothetical protein
MDRRRALGAGDLLRSLAAESWCRVKVELVREETDAAILSLAKATHAAHSRSQFSGSAMPRSCLAFMNRVCSMALVVGKNWPWILYSNITTVCVQYLRESTVKFNPSNLLALLDRHNI